MSYWGKGEPSGDGSQVTDGWDGRVREGAFDPRTVTITLLDEKRATVCSWVLKFAQPKKWVGPTLAAKGGGEVTMEELHLVAEEVEFVSS